MKVPLEMRRKSAFGVFPFGFSERRGRQLDSFVALCCLLQAFSPSKDSLKYVKDVDEDLSAAWKNEDGQLEAPLHIPSESLGEASSHIAFQKSMGLRSSVMNSINMRAPPYA